MNRALWSSTMNPQLSTLNRSKAPIPRVAEVAIDRPGRELGNDRRPPLVLGRLDSPKDLLNKSGVEAEFNQCGQFVPPVHHVIQEPVHRFVGEAQLTLIGLSRPQVTARRLSDDLGWDIEMRGEAPDLGLVEVADGVQRRGHIAVEGAVAQEELRFVSLS